MTHRDVNPNDYDGSDSQRIQQAVADAAARGVALVIPRLNDKPLPGQPDDLWVIDEAITLPSNFIVELDNCRIQLSDRCRDNFFRSANCGMGIDPIHPATNIHIRGRGRAMLIGADRPRATGDGRKTLGERTFGTDAGKPGESQQGDWRNIGILLAQVTHFSIENLTIVDSHAWAISLEYCAQGTLRDLHFDSTGKKEVDGQSVTILNQDGVDLRQGCHDILIENITGQTGDDLVALTAIPLKAKPAGSVATTMVSGGPDEVNGIHDVTIRHVRGHCAGGHNIVRLLNTGKLPMENIVLDGVIDTSRPPHRSSAAVRIGDGNPAYGGVNELGLTRQILVSHIISRAKHAVMIGGSLCDSTFTNIVQQRVAGDEPGQAITYHSGQDHVRNLHLHQVVHAGAQEGA